MTGKLFLSGGGNEKQTFVLDEVFLKSIEKILYIPVAWKNDDFKSCLKWFKNMISVHNKEVAIKMLTDLRENINLEEYDAVYIGGGNTFKLLKKIRENKFDKKLVEFYKNGGTIYGGSAGAIIWGKDIETALLCKDADENLVNLKPTNGLNLINGFDIQCHFEDNQIKEHQKFTKKAKTSVIAIPEESALLVDNSYFRVIGINPITVITEKEIRKYNPNEKFKL